MFSQFYVTENGASAEFAVTGSEGVVGVASLLGAESTPSQAAVRALSLRWARILWCFPALAAATSSSHSRSLKELPRRNALNARVKRRVYEIRD